MSKNHNKPPNDSNHKQSENTVTSPTIDAAAAAILAQSENVTTELQEGVVSEGSLTVPTPLIDPNAAQPASEVAEPTPVVVIPQPTLSTPPFPHDAYALPLSSSSSSRLVIQELKDYVELMNQKVRLHSTAGGQAQAGLYHTLMQIINSPAEEFTAVFTLAMQIIKDELAGAFSDVNVHRYTPHVTLPAKSTAHLRYLVNALITLADPATREVGKRQTNVEQALGSHLIKEEARQRVLAFFNF